MLFLLFRFLSLLFFFLFFLKIELNLIFTEMIMWKFFVIQGFLFCGREFEERKYVSKKCSSKKKAGMNFASNDRIIELFTLNYFRFRRAHIFCEEGNSCCFMFMNRGNLEKGFLRYTWNTQETFFCVRK